MSAFRREVRIIERDATNRDLQVILDLFLDRAAAIPMSERKAAVDFRLGRILRREEIVELFFRVDDARVRIAEGEGAVEKILLDRVEQLGCLPNEINTRQE